MELDDLFSQFWAAYPRRPGNPRKAAMDSYAKLVGRHGIDPEVILSGTRAYAKTRLGEDQKYTAHATTFLNQHRFMDFEEEKEVVPAGFYASAGSPELAAWDEHKRAATGIDCPRDRAGGWWVASQWPPGANVVEFKRGAA